MDLVWKIEPTDIEWEMDYTSMKASKAFAENKRIQTKPDKEIKFETDAAIAHMLINGVVFLNSHWWREEWPSEAQKMISVNVNCNDVFAWGCADAESLPYREIETIYRMWIKDPDWGPAVWCMIQRNQMPQKPVEDRIRKAGIWDLDKLGLGANTMDAECKAYLQGMIASGALKTAS